MDINVNVTAAMLADGKITESEIRTALGNSSGNMGLNLKFNITSGTGPVQIELDDNNNLNGNLDISDLSIIDTTAAHSFSVLNASGPAMSNLGIHTELKTLFTSANGVVTQSGDVNGDGYVRSADALLIRKYALATDKAAFLKTNNISLSQQDFERIIDLDGDGKVTLLDSTNTLRKATKLGLLTDSTGKAIQLSDVTGDGSVKSNDALLIKQYCLAPDKAAFLKANNISLSKTDNEAIAYFEALADFDSNGSLTSVDSLNTLNKAVGFDLLSISTGKILNIDELSVNIGSGAGAMPTSEIVMLLNYVTDPSDHASLLSAIANVRSGTELRELLFSAALSPIDQSSLIKSLTNVGGINRLGEVIDSGVDSMSTLNITTLLTNITTTVDHASLINTIADVRSGTELRDLLFSGSLSITDQRSLIKSLTDVSGTNRLSDVIDSEEGSMSTLNITTLLTNIIDTTVHDALISAIADVRSGTELRDRLKSGSLTATDQQLIINTLNSNNRLSDVIDSGEGSLSTANITTLLTNVSAADDHNSLISTIADVRSGPELRELLFSGSLSITDQRSLTHTLTDVSGINRLSEIIDSGEGSMSTINITTLLTNIIDTAVHDALISAIADVRSGTELSDLLNSSILTTTDRGSLINTLANNSRLNDVIGSGNRSISTTNIKTLLSTITDPTNHDSLISTIADVRSGAELRELIITTAPPLKKADITAILNNIDSDKLNNMIGSSGVEGMSNTNIKTLLSNVSDKTAHDSLIIAIAVVRTSLELRELLLASPPLAKADLFALSNRIDLPALVGTGAGSMTDADIMSYLSTVKDVSAHLKILSAVITSRTPTELRSLITSAGLAKADLTAILTRINQDKLQKVIGTSGATDGAMSTTQLIGLLTKVTTTALDANILSAAVAMRKPSELKELLLPNESTLGKTDYSTLLSKINPVVMGNIIGTGATQMSKEDIIQFLSTVSNNTARQKVINAIASTQNPSELRALLTSTAPTLAKADLTAIINKIMPEKLNEIIGTSGATNGAMTTTQLIGLLTKVTDRALDSKLLSAALTTRSASEITELISPTGTALGNSDKTALLALQKKIAKP